MCSIEAIGLVIDLYNDKKELLCSKKLIRVPLEEDYYNKKGLELFGADSPCIMQRKKIEMDACKYAIDNCQLGNIIHIQEENPLKGVYELDCDYFKLYTNNKGAGN